MTTFVAQILRYIKTTIILDHRQESMICATRDLNSDERRNCDGVGATVALTVDCNSGLSAHRQLLTPVGSSS
jgi:hypothetical protein